MLRRWPRFTVSYTAIDSQQNQRNVKRPEPRSDNAMQMAAIHEEI